VVRYSFTVMDLHHLLLAGLPAHYTEFRLFDAEIDAAARALGVHVARCGQLTR
jgi:hypothetical protein